MINNKYLEIANQDKKVDKNNYQIVDIKDSIELDSNKKIILIKLFKLFKDHFYNILSISCFILSVIFYYLSSEGCNLGQYECVVQLKKGQLNRLIYRLISTSFFYCIFLILIIHKKISKKFLVLNVVYIYLFNKYYKADWDDHGFFTRIFFILFVLLFLFCFEYLKLIILIFKKKYYKLFSFLILFPIIIYFYIKYGFRNTKCDGWEKGLLNTQIESKEDSLKANKCYMMTPKICDIEASDNFHDYSKYLKRTCKNRDNSKKNLEKFFSFDKNIKYKYIAFPSTLNLNYHEDGAAKVFHKKILSMVTPVNSTKDDPYKEVFVEFNNNVGKVIIDLKKNNTLIEERENLAKQFETKYDNIFFLYTDAVSRPHFIRKMKKTVKLLEDYYFNNPKKKKGWNAYQFFKYNSFASTTPPNTIPMFFGNSSSSKVGTTIIKYFKEHGYITAYSQNQCNRYLFDPDERDKTFEFVNFDHECISLFCDPNYSHPDLYSSFINGAYSALRRCLYGNDTYNHVFEYGKQFVEKYRNQRKFLKLAFIEGHEGSKEVIKYLDEAFCNFIKYLMKEFPTNSAIIIVSDHGNNMGGYFHLNTGEEFFIERGLPNLYIILEENGDYNHTAIEINEQRYITPYEIHETLCDMTGLYNEKYISKYGQTLFQEISEKRKCSDYEQFKQSMEYCRCIDD